MIQMSRPTFGPEEESAVLEVMRSGQFAQGVRVREFERAFALATGAEYAVATSSGTTALFLALRAHGVGPGDEVITSPLTFIATANAIVHAGAVPVFADVDESLGLSVAAVARLIGPRTRALVPVHLHGNPCDLHSLIELAARHGLAVIQDACQAVGAGVAGRRLGTHSTAVYSFYATKNLTTGEGGMVTTNDPQVADLCAALRHQAYAGPAYVHDRVGYNFRMTELQAAIGLVQLGRLAAITARRRLIASYYDEAIGADRFARPATLPNACHVYHQYTLRLNAEKGGARQERDRIRASLAEAGVATGVYYPVPVHRQPAYEGYAASSCPSSERASDDMFSIPVHHSLSDAEVETVAQAVAALWTGKLLVSSPHNLIVDRKVLDAVPEPGQPPGLRDVGVAKDLAQDALVAAQEQWPKSKVLRDPGAWLMGIGKRRAIDLLRRRDRLELRGGRRLLGLGGTVALAALLGSGAACVAQSRPASGLAGPEAAHSATTDTLAQGTSLSAGRLWGLWEPRWQASNSTDFTQYTRVEALLGRRADIVHWYADWTEGWDYDGRLVDQVLQGGRAPMITWEAWDRPLRTIAAGQYDAYVDSWASGMAARQPEPIYLRIFHEFNDPVKHSSGSGYPWGVGGGTANRPADLVAAWRHVHDRFKLAGASNVRFVWSPDGVHLDLGLLRAAYPGDAYVDFAGWDTYGYDIAAGYRTLREVTQRPFMLPEVGSTDPAWVRNLMAKIASGQYGAIQAVVWFDQDSSRLDTNPGVAAALRNALASFR